MVKMRYNSQYERVRNQMSAVLGETFGALVVVAAAMVGGWAQKSVYWSEKSSARAEKTASGDPPSDGCDF
jgi:hypothetical protein